MTCWHQKDNCSRVDWGKSIAASIAGFVPAALGGSCVLRLPETQGVGDNGYRTEAHGGTGDHGVQQDAGEWIENPGSDWHAEHIVDKGKEEILPDVPHNETAEADCLDDAAKVAL